MDREKIFSLAQQNGINISYCTEEMYSECQNSNKEQYGIQDCALIRTTNVFPANKVIQTPIHGGAYSFIRNDLFFDAIINKFFESSYENFKEEDFDIYYEICRTTLHFTINGLVSNHDYGNFSNNPYIIIEPLKYHVDDESLIGLRVEDTYFNDDIDLSDEAVLMIPSDQFETIVNDSNYHDTLRNFKLIVFEGNEEQAVNYVLNKLGYDAFLTNQHSYVGGIQEQKMIDFINTLADAKQISTEKHYYSQVKEQDTQNRINSIADSEMQFLNYVLDSVDIEEELHGEITFCIENGLNTVLKRHINKLVDVVGLETLKQLTQQYNEQRIFQNSIETNKIK